MNIKKPVLTREPELVKDFYSLLLEVRREECSISKMLIRDITLTEEDLSKIDMFDVVFENCRAVNCNFDKTSFVNVVFKNCDFSNCSFKDGYFKQCEFILCKCMGSSIQNSYWKHIRIHESNFRYAVLDRSKLEHICFSESDVSNANMSNCKLVDFQLEKVNVINTVFFRTSLKNVDFTGSEMMGITVSDDFTELRGAVVTHLQAADLAKLMGVIVK